MFLVFFVKKLFFGENLKKTCKILKMKRSPQSIERYRWGSESEIPGDLKKDPTGGAREGQLSKIGNMLHGDLKTRSLWIRKRAIPKVLKKIPGDPKMRSLGT
jgi:hypothetical protein